jgi:hypothetical protein
MTRKVDIKDNIGTIAAFQYKKLKKIKSNYRCWCSVYPAGCGVKKQRIHQCKKRENALRKIKGVK